MNANVGAIDRILRLVVGLGLVAWGLGYVPDVAAPEWGLIAAIVGGVLAVTALIGFCPIYRVLGVSSCAKRA